MCIRESCFAYGGVSTKWPHALTKRRRERRRNGSARRRGRSATRDIMLADHRFRERLAGLDHEALLSYAAELSFAHRHEVEPLIRPVLYDDVARSLQG